MFLIRLPAFDAAGLAARLAHFADGDDDAKRIYGLPSPAAPWPPLTRLLLRRQGRRRDDID